MYNMSELFREFRLGVEENINQQTVETLNTLTSLWTEMFDYKVCMANAHTLTEHVTIFYNEIIDETKARRNKIKLEIKQMYKEASDLKKMLNYEINLNSEHEGPILWLHAHLNECLKTLREQLDHRKAKISILLEEQEELCKVLEQHPRELKIGSVLPTEEDLYEFREYLDDLIKEKCSRLNEFNKLRIDIEILSLKLNIVDSSDDTLLTDQSLPLTKKNLSKLYNLRTELQNRYNVMREKIEQMKTNLEKLWEVFDLNDSVKNQFDNIEYNQDNYQLISHQLEYWEQERRGNIKQFIIKAREEISYWLNKNLWSESEKASIVILQSNCFTEDLLTSHETKLKDLKDFHAAYRKLFDLIEERQQLWHRMQAMEGQARDPGRYTNRGGQLLKEEKERKIISKKLPAIENEIIALAEAYAKSTNVMFTVYGTPAVELIEQDWAKINEYKEEIKFSRKRLLNDSTPIKQPKLKRQVSTIKKVMKSVSHLASANGNTENARFHIPKHLIKDIPTRKIVGTPSTIKLAYPTENRRSAKLRKSKERRVSTGRISKTHIQINNSAGTDSVNYESFKDYITPRSPCRSSMVSPKDKKTRALKSIKKMPLTPIPGTPTSLKKLHLTKSPTTNRTPRTSPSVRNFSTLNLPILI